MLIFSIFHSRVRKDYVRSSSGEMSEKTPNCYNLVKRIKKMGKYEERNEISSPSEREGISGGKLSKYR